MNTETRHTPTPWKTDKADGTSEPQIYTSDGETVIAVCFDIVGDEQAPNAEYIVQAVNNHAALVRLATGLEATARRMNQDQHAGIAPRPVDWSDLYQECNELRALLSQLEAK